MRTGQPTGSAFRPSLDGHRDVRPSGETEIELASGEAANFLDRGLDLDPHEVTHHPYNGQNFTNQQKAQDFWIAHASVTLTTSPEFGETSVSDLTPAPYSLDRFLHLDGHRVFFGFVYMESGICYGQS